VDRMLRVDQLSDEEIIEMREVYAGAAHRIGKTGVDWIQVVTLVGFGLLQFVKWYQILNGGGATSCQGGRQGGRGGPAIYGGGGVLGRRR
jgi:hypothetical protein